MRRLRIYSETIEQMFYRLEHLGEYVVTRDYPIGGLVDMDVRRMSTYEPRIGTYVQYDTESRIDRFQMWE